MHTGERERRRGCIPSLKPMYRRTLLLALTIIAVSSAVHCQSDGLERWEMLTRQNFSSQIRLHPNILLLVAVPWSGESRSLMRETARFVADRQEEFGSLKLMHVHKNKERLLGDAIGTSGEEISILFYHQSVSYKYRGKLRASNILLSVLPYMSASPGEIPLKGLNTQEELDVFLESTDKALLLLEFCGWTRKLLAAGRDNGTEVAFGTGGDSSGRSFEEEPGGISTASREGNQKGMDSADLKSSIQNGFGGVPWLEEFSSANESATPQETDSHCNFEEFQQFDSVFSKFMAVAREFFLPPERHRFGLVSDRTLLSSLGVEDSGSWSIMLYFGGCPSCSQILKKEDDLMSALKMHKSIATELEHDGLVLDAVVPANKPSVILFVDRSSVSSETRRKSKEALEAFRELALHYHLSDQMDEQHKDSPESVSQEFRSGHPRLRLFSTTQKIRLKDKMSIVIMNEGKNTILDNIASDLQGSSLHEILTNFLQKKNEAKLSSIAKGAGFELLSEDLDVKLAGGNPSEQYGESKQVSITLSEDGLVQNIVDSDKGSASNHEEGSIQGNIKSYFEDHEEKNAYSKSRNLLSVEADELASDNGIAVSKDAKEEENSSSQVEKLMEDYIHLQSFVGSFFFSDGNYRLLKSLTGQTRIPSVVITDPISQQHFVFPGQKDVTYSSLENFLHRFLNGSLVPYQFSEFQPENHREGTCPPFVNLDFHESDSIPRITAHTFSEQVYGFNQSEREYAAHAWNEDVLVLFTNSWCGFCQRMELVVREVYRAVKGYMSTLSKESRKVETACNGADGLKNVKIKAPKILLMDCTLSDCTLIMKSIKQREVYPTLLLFPAERKMAVSYEGDLAVADVIKFIAEHGSNSGYLTSEKGILWTMGERRGRTQKLVGDASATRVRHDTHFPHVKNHEVLLKKRTPKRTTEHNWVKPQIPKELHEAAPNVAVGSILIATEKISTQPFDKSMILIVKADQNTGFHGLICNKRISWDTLPDLEYKFEQLKEAPLSLGGPFILQGRPLVALARQVVNDQHTEVAPGICFLDQLATLGEIEGLRKGNRSLTNYWFFLGFASWGWNQLFDEIAEGAWNVTANKLGPIDWPHL